MDTKINEKEVRQMLDEQVVANVLGTPVTRAELAKAFDRVAPASHWKNPIDAEVVLSADLPTFDQEVIREAVIFFTGSVPSFHQLGNGRTRVVAAGYFAAVGP